MEGAEQDVVDEGSAFASKIPPPFPGGEETHESLGRFVDRLMGHQRDAREADAALAPLLMKDEDFPEDPEPVEIPEPIPDADEPVRRGRWPDGEAHA